MNNNGLQIHDFSAQAQKIYILSSSTGTVHETTQLENCSLGFTSANHLFILNKFK